MRKFITESGVIVGPHNTALHYVSGEMTHVDFPEDIIWDIHKRTPGNIFKLAHTHPPGMYQMSSRDKQTLETWAFALYPYPARLSTITERKLMGEESVFVETVYVSQLEAKSIWLNRKQKAFTFSKGETPFLSRLINTKCESQKIVGPWDSDWMKIVLEDSYK